MEDQTKIRLTAAEMSTLWAQFINDTVSVCMNSHFLEKVEDAEVLPIIELVLKCSERRISILKTLFMNEKFPIPIGFTEEDVIPKAPRLFSDTFVLMYLREMSILAMAASGASLGIVTREDVVDFHKVVLQDAIQLQDQTRRLMLKQGTYIRPPFISTPDEVDFVEKQQFLAGFFGKKRSLTAVEVTHLFLNVQTNAIGKALITGFAQIAEKDDVKQYLLRGKELAQKHMDIFSHFLTKEDLPAPMSWDSGISD
ncbi:DUF3231 family protein, partial [Neobacillus sp. Marseille-QA0830]